MSSNSAFEFTRVPGTVNQVIKLHSRSFHIASLLLPTTVRRNVSLLYAWCRWCDDAIDKAVTPEIGRVRLAALRCDVERLQAGNPPLQACSRWLMEVADSHEIPPELYHDLLDAMETDATGPSIRNEQDLLLYCYRAAGSVGLMMSRVLGVRDARAFPHAKSLGIAMQLTNIARDIGEDRRMGRCYVPATWRAATTHSPSKQPSKVHVVRLLELAEEHYRDGLKGLRYLPWQVRLSIRTAAAFYREIGVEIARNNFDAVTQRAVVPWSKKLVVLFRSLAEEIGSTMQRKLQSLDLPFFRFLSFRGDPAMKNESRYVVSLGLSLTLIMATALFALVGINPKDSSYQWLPWIYSAISALSAVVFGVFAKRLQEQLSAESEVARVLVSRESSGSKS